MWIPTAIFQTLLGTADDSALLMHTLSKLGVCGVLPSSRIHSHSSASKELAPDLGYLANVGSLGSERPWEPGYSVHLGAWTPSETWSLGT